jgi:CMP-N,N'-diacetyllegionaminic acid synthase
MSLRPLLAVIPARLGSKGLPRKNIRPFAGLPLIAHSIKFAAMCNEVDRSVISTESEEIAEIARAHGGDVPFIRPAELATDGAPTSPVLQHALHQVEQQEGKRYGSVLLLQPTSPARLPTDLSEALTMLESNAAAVGVVAVAETAFNPRYVCVQRETETLTMAFPEANGQKRRQDVAGVYRITGSLYLWRRDYVQQTSDINLARDPHRMLVIPKERAIDIDDLYDFQIAELAVSGGICPLPWLSSVHGMTKA